MNLSDFKDELYEELNNMSDEDFYKMLVKSGLHECPLINENPKLTLFSKTFMGYDFIVFTSKLFQFRWFTDCGEWFLYIHLGKRYWRFSSAGFIKGRNKEERENLFQ